MSNVDVRSTTSRLKVVLPSHMSSFFRPAEYLPSAPNEARQYQRLIVRCRAAMVIESSPAEFDRGEYRTEVLIQDISQSGIAFLWHERMHAGEIVFLRFQGRQIRAEIVRCKELGPRCFDCGAVLLFFKNLEDTDFN
jgi:PilZ domain